MRKLTDVAKQLNITPQAIYKRKKRDAVLAARIERGTVHRGKYTFLEDDAVDAIVDAFKDGATEPEPDNKLESNGLATVLYEQMSVLNRQLEEKDKQIAQLQTLLNQQQQLQMKTQHLLEAPRRPWWRTVIERRQHHEP